MGCSHSLACGSSREGGTRTAAAIDRDVEINADENALVLQCYFVDAELAGELWGRWFRDEGRQDENVVTL